MFSFYMKPAVMCVNVKSRLDICYSILLNCSNIQLVKFTYFS